MAGSKVGESKWITAGKLIELLSGLHPDTMVAANDITISRSTNREACQRSTSVSLTSGGK